MVGSPNGQQWPGVADFVEAYETAQEHNGHADVTEFAPPPVQPAPFPSQAASFRRGPASSARPASGIQDMERAASTYRLYLKNASGRPDELRALLEADHIPVEQAAFLRELDRIDPHAAEQL